ncbi:MAG: hypothetical protein ACJ8MR_17510 [Povalibacter sp.]
MRYPILIAALCSLFSVANAEDNADARNPLEAKVIVDAGWFLMSTDMRVRVDGENTSEQGSDVKFDDTFGIGDFDRFRADVMWRFSSRHSIRAMYFQNNRSASKSITRDVTFRDETFPVGATVNAQSDLTIAQLSYDYAFVRRPTYEIAGGIGVHYVDMKLGLNATVTAQGATGTRTLDQSATTSAPLPVLGLRGIWKLPHNLYLTGQAQYFYVQLDPYEGSLLDLKASFVWQLSDHVGVGVAYDDFAFRFDITDRPKFDGSLRWDYGGTVAFVSVMF